jgi:hypothetical protein
VFVFFWLFSAMQLKMTIKNPFLNAQLQSKPLTIRSLIFLANGLHPVIPAFKSETDMNTFTSKALPLMKTYTSWDGVSNLNHGNNKNDVTTESTVVFMETFTDDAVGAADASASGAADASASGAADEGAASGPADAGASGDAAAASGPAEEPAADASGPAEEPAADATAAEAGASGAAAFRFRGAAVQQARLVEANDW